MKKNQVKFINTHYKLLTAAFVLLSMAAVSFQLVVAKNNTSRESNESMEQVYEEHVPGQLIVKFKEGVVPDANFLKSHNALSAEKISKAGKTESKASESFKKFGIDRMYLADFSENANLAELIKKLNNDSRVEYAEPNYIYHADADEIIPNDLVDELWGMRKIDAPEAWYTQTGSSSVVIAVIDTGVDYGHEDLSANMWVNVDETLNSEDDDGNGFIDDVYGWDFANGDNDPFDDVGHGTHCAGTIGAVGDNTKGVVGVNWDVTIMPIKFLGLRGGTTANAVLSVEYAVDNGADIMSNSWGGGAYSVALRDAISAANNAGVLFVASAGNRGQNIDEHETYPAGYDLPNVISVAATDKYDELADWSNYGVETVDLGAPGVGIYSTVIGDSYASHSGTSMAAPHVSGVAGLLKAEYPDITLEQMKISLFNGTDEIPALDGKTVTGGRLNAFNSLGITLVADAGGDKYGVEGGTITFDGSGSYDLDGSIVSYEWDFDASNGIGKDATGATTDHSYVAGDYTVTLTVTDNEENSATDTATVVIREESDAVTITKARYFTMRNTLEVEAESTAGEYAGLVAVVGEDEEYEMKYDPIYDIYSLNVTTTDSISEITVTSNFGSFIDADVKISGQ